MKTSHIPSLRVAPELRQAAEDLLREGESLSSFVEQSLREAIDRRRNQSEFIKRGLISRANAQEAGVYLSAESVLNRLEQSLADAKASGKPTR